VSAQPVQGLSRYRILEKIGEGGVGVVHRARDTRLKRDVALKVLGPGLLTDSQARQRFRQEALTLSKLNHPHIATVYDFDRQNDQDFLVMEYIAGKTMDERLAGEALPLDETLRLGVELVEGLAAAHDEGVLHRDLKPGNLRVTPDGRLKILDFGLAKLLQNDDQSTTIDALTGTQQILGTLRYMAPERLRGEPADIRSDIYATGAVLYEMATGQPTFSQPYVPAVIAAVLEQAPRPPSVLNPALSSVLERIILKCLEKDSAHRYSSANELLAELRHLRASPDLASAACKTGVEPRRVDLDARRAYDRGRALWRRRTRQSAEGAINLFQRAIGLDSSYAKAHAGLADAYAALLHTLELCGSMPFDKWLRLQESVNSKALAAAGRALELDSALAQAHATKGRVLRWWNMEEGERELRRSIALDSSYVWAHVWYGGLLSARGRHAEAIAEAELAVSLEPETQSVNRELGVVLAHAQSYDRAIAQLEKTIAMDPSWADAHRWLMFVYLYLERYEEAILELRRWHELVRRDPEPFIPIFRAMINRVPTQEVLVAIESYEHLYGPYRAAELLAKLGETDGALEALERAYQLRDENLPRWVTLLPLLSPLHSGPRFVALVKRLGLNSG
jgi:tetratricopeptide (TPR) repeat protein